jgi:toxin-antitoxin system PIN domain toxin
VKTALLDVNVLLALAWPNHQHHGAAHKWVASEAKFGWATCATTQLSFVRLSSNPAFTPAAVSPSDAAILLQRWTEHRMHQFWESLPANEPGIFKNAINHQQVMDAWLVHMAENRNGRFVTFDQRTAGHAKSKSAVFVLQP